MRARCLRLIRLISLSLPRPRALNKLSPPPHATSPHPTLGVILKLLSVVLLVAMAVCVKMIGKSVPIGETIFVRCVIAIVALAVLARFTVGLQVLKTDRPLTHALRSLSGTSSMFCYFAALSIIPMAQVTALGLTSPMFVTLMAMMFLGERIHAFRWAALILGLCGALLITLPDLDWQHGKTLGFGLAFGATFFSALAMIFLRSMSSQEHAITITFYFMVTAAACALLTLPFGWLVPTGKQAWLIALTGVFGVSGQLLMTFSYRYADASTIAPLDYTNLVFSVTFGMLLFNEQPDWSLGLGAPLIIASGLIIFWREYRLQQARTAIES